MDTIKARKTLGKQLSKIISQAFSRAWELGMTVEQAIEASKPTVMAFSQIGSQNITQESVVAPEPVSVPQDITPEYVASPLTPIAGTFVPSYSPMGATDAAPVKATSKKRATKASSVAVAMSAAISQPLPTPIKPVIPTAPSLAVPLAPIPETSKLTAKQAPGFTMPTNIDPNWKPDMSFLNLSTQPARPFVPFQSNQTQPEKVVPVKAAYEPYKMTTEEATKDWDSRAPKAAGPTAAIQSNMSKDWEDFEPKKSPEKVSVTVPLVAAAVVARVAQTEPPVFVAKPAAQTNEPLVPGTMFTQSQIDEMRAAKKAQDEKNAQAKFGSAPATCIICGYSIASGMGTTVNPNDFSRLKHKGECPKGKS